MNRFGFDEHLADQAEEHITGKPARPYRLGRDLEREEDDRFDLDHKANFYDCSNTGMGWRE